MQNRLIKKENLHNFRDFGGLETIDDRIIKTNKFYRSARLDKLNSQEQAYLKELGINTIFDFRAYNEMLTHPDPIIEDINVYVIPAITDDKSAISPAQLESFFKENPQENFYSMMIDMYKKLPFKNCAYHLMVDKIAQCNEDVILQHCTVGRDRTGVGSAIILLLLNVDRNLIIEDYMLSNIGLLNFYDIMLEKYHLDEQAKQDLISIIELRSDYINVALDTIINKYGSFDNYLINEFKITKEDIDKIRDYYTQEKTSL